MAENKNVGVIALSSYEETIPLERLKSGSYVSWGSDDKYPEFLYKLSRKCPTLGSIITNTKRMIISNGIENSSALKDVNEDGDMIEDVLGRLVEDILIFGGCTYQVKFNRLGAVIGLNYLDIRRFRLGEGREICYVSDSSCYITGKKPEYHTMKLYNKDTAASDGVQIVYIKANGRGLYPTPFYEGSITDCETQIETKTFNFNEIHNNFLSSAIMNFNGVQPATEDEKNKIVADVNNKLGGAKSAGYIMCFFNDGGADGVNKKVELERLQTDDLPDRYINISEQSRAEIFISMSAHPQLFGMATSTGFASIEYTEAKEMYKESMLDPIIGYINRSIANSTSSNSIYIKTSKDNA